MQNRNKQKKKTKKLRFRGLTGGSLIKNLPANAGDVGSILGQDDPLEEEMATHSSILAWRIHGQGSLAGYSPWGCRVGNNLATTQNYTHTQFGLPRWH